MYPPDDARAYKAYNRILTIRISLICSTVVLVFAVVFGYAGYRSHLYSSTPVTERDEYLRMKLDYEDMQNRCVYGNKWSKRDFETRLKWRKDPVPQ